ncbi:hypothetical protein A0H81_03437 [Grifola frondosa]|uniref:Uncharacterized protein n=1 Tax=Grifola frondosa TaxID=5627 RepID=A0A1C7MHL0_GRIFR|nr:hypothetical protein A0H81_03437 [Grifola frondosa]
MPRPCSLSWTSTSAQQSARILRGTRSSLAWQCHAARARVAAALRHLQEYLEALNIKEHVVAPIVEDQ